MPFFEYHKKLQKMASEHILFMQIDTYHTEETIYAYNMKLK